MYVHVYTCVILWEMKWHYIGQFTLYGCVTTVATTAHSSLHEDYHMDNKHLSPLDGTHPCTNVSSIHVVISMLDS